MYCISTIHCLNENSTIFKTINSSVDETRKTLALFNKDWNTYKTNWQQGFSQNGFAGGVKSIFQSSSQNSVISKDQVQILRNWNNAVSHGCTNQETFNRIIANADDNTKMYFAGLNKGKGSIEGLKNAQNVAKQSTIGLTIAQTALNMAISMGLMAAISLAIKGFDKLVNSAKRASEAADEAFSDTNEKVQQNEEEAKSLDELISKYKELKESGNLDIDGRKEVKELQNDIADLVGTQAKNLDLVNGKLDDEIKKLDEISAKEAKNAYETATANYNNSKKAKEKATGDESFLFVDGYAYTGKREKETEKILKDAGFSSNVQSGGFFGNTLFVMDSFDNNMKELKGAQEKADYLQSMIDVLEQNGQRATDLYTGLIKQRDAYLKYIDDQQSASNSLVNSWITYSQFSNEELSKINVNSVESFDTYRQKMIEEAKNDESIGNLLSDGVLSEEDLEKAVNDFMATSLNFSKWYEQWLGNVQGSTSEHKTDILSFADVFNSSDFSEAKEKLLELASAGELTPETLSSTEDYNKLLTETGLLAQDACDQIYEMVSATERLNATATGLSSLTDLYKQSKENGFVDIESLSGLSDAFKGLNSYQSFVDILGSGTHTADEMQVAFNKLTSEYLEHTKVLDGLTDTNKALYVQQLKNYGIVNAQELVDKKLAQTQYNDVIDSYFKAAQGSEEWNSAQKDLNNLISNETKGTLDDFTDGNYEAHQSLLNESNASNICRQAIADLELQQIQFNNHKLTVEDNIKALAKLANSYGITGTTAQGALKAMEQVKQMQDAGASVGIMFTQEQQDAMYQEMQEKLAAQFQVDYSVNFDGGSDAQKELAKNTEKANSEAEKSVEIFDWIEPKIKRIQTVISEFGQTASNVFKSLTARSSAYGNQISKVTEEISLQQQAYDAYMQKANSVGLSEEYASKVRNGAMNIDEISDETLKTQISDYQTWFEKAQDCLNTVNDLQEEFASLNIDRLQLSIDKINNKLEKTQTNADKIKARIDDTTRVTKASDYDKLDVNYNQQIKSLSEENKLIAEQQKYVEKDSEKWIELEKNIRDNNTSISDLKKNIKENKVLRIEIKLEAQSNALDDLEKDYGKIQDKISLRETSGQYVSSKDYDNLNKNISKQITKLKEQNKTYADMQKQVKKGSKDWNDYKDSIDSNNSSIRQLTQSMIENAKAKADLIQTKTDDKISKIDSADELLNAKIQNTGLYSKKNAYTSSKINNVDKRLSAYNNNVKTFSSKVNSSKNSINNSKANKSFLAKIKTYTKKNKVIPSVLIAQAVKLGYNNLATQCADYNSYLVSLEAAKITADLYKETSKKEKADLAQEKADNIENYYSNRQNTYNQRATELNNKMDLIQTQGYVISENYYSKLIANEKDNNALLVKERDKLVVQLNKSVANGDIKKGSDEWYAMCQQINNVTNAIDESTKSLVEYQNAMRQLKWDNFDHLEQRISSITDETDFMINQLSRKELASDDIGGLTDEGKAVNSLHIANMTAYKQQSYDYKHEIEKINKELAKDPYNKELINRKDELVQKYQECIDKANQEKYAVIDLYKQGYDALKNKISEVTNEYTSLLDEMKSAYDYSNDIADKTQKIAQLRKQLNAYTSTDMSEETQATVQKLQVSLKDAEKDLKDTQYDRFISDTKDILSDLQDNLSDDIDKIIDDLDEKFEKVIKENNKISSDAANTIKESMVGIGYTSTENFMTILDSSNFVTGIKETLADIKEYHRKMNEYIKDKEFAEQVTDAIKTTTGVSGNAVTEGMKLIGIPGYAKGSKNIPYDQLAFLAEKGTELQYDTSQGVLRTVGKGDMVFTNDMAKNLWKLAQSNPINFASNLMPTMPDVKSNYTGGDVNISYGDIVMNGVNDPETFGKQLREEICKNGKTTQCITEAVSSKQMGNGIGKARLYR